MSRARSSWSPGPARLGELGSRLPPPPRHRPSRRWPRPRCRLRPDPGGGGDQGPCRCAAPTTTKLGAPAGWMSRASWRRSPGAISPASATTSRRPRSPGPRRLGRRPGWRVPGRRLPGGLSWPTSSNASTGDLVGAPAGGGRVVEGVAHLGQATVRLLSGESLDPADVGADRGLRGDQERAHLSGRVGGSAAELHREVADLHDPHDLAVLVAEEGERPSSSPRPGT